MLDGVVGSGGGGEGVVLRDGFLVFWQQQKGSELLESHPSISRRFYCFRNVDADGHLYRGDRIITRAGGEIYSPALISRYRGVIVQLG